MEPNRRLFIDNDSSSESNWNQYNKRFPKKTLNILLKVKQQNQQILNILIGQKQDRDAPGLKLAPPTVDLPLKTVTDVNRLEAYLANEKNLAALAAYCEILGGKDKVGKINTILRCLIFNQVLCSKFEEIPKVDECIKFG
ncbi:hypothetical protein JTB14_018019 [Gonioctena quinquepunctata]|nr:hypothetical protein JTB14_018019 [Gonioctena quinquepunctata]